MLGAGKARGGGEMECVLEGADGVYEVGSAEVGVWFRACEWGSSTAS